ncbi:unnamed protein product [Agarophyton chilense]
MSGVSIAPLAAVFVVGALMYRSCAIFPDLGKALALSAYESSNHDGNIMSSMISFESSRYVEDSPRRQMWKSASEHSNAAVEMEQEAAAAVRGQFATVLKPGAARVRPPDVMTRLTILGICMSLEQEASSSKEKFNSEVGMEHVQQARRGTAIIEKIMVDLSFVFDASGAPSWRNFRRMREILCTQGGVIDNVQKQVHEGSTVGFLE